MKTPDDSQEHFFSKPNFKLRFDHQMKIIRSLIGQKVNKENIKQYLNQFVKTCFAAVKGKDIQMHMHLEVYRTLSYYGEIYESKETFENIIKSIESPKLKENLFKKKPATSCLVYGETLLKYYGMENEKGDGWFTSEGFEIIRKGKFYLLKAYTQSIEGKNKLSESEFSYCLVLLSACFMHLSRWFEPIFYLKLLKERDLEDPNYDYLTALNLDALKEKSCLDYNGQLLLKILDCSIRVIKNTRLETRQKDHMNDIHAQCLRDLERIKPSIETLRKHQKKIADAKRKRNAYSRYCIENQLFLNEHSFFCSCGKSVGDTLEVKTLHTHTQLAWVAKFEKLLATIISDFTTARHNLYQSESNEPSAYLKRLSANPSALQLQKDSHLKNAFKICYSILDQICYGIFEALEMNIEKTLRITKVSIKARIKRSIF